MKAWSISKWNKKNTLLKLKKVMWRLN